MAGTLDRQNIDGMLALPDKVETHEHLGDARMRVCPDTDETLNHSGNIWTWAPSPLGRCLWNYEFEVNPQS